MNSVLDRICADKRDEIVRRKRERPLATLLSDVSDLPPPRGFAVALDGAVSRHGWALIGEIKKTSPSRGPIRADFDPPALARAYEWGGATCLSVLTDEAYFHGTADHLVAARAAVELPILRKDFILDPYQVVESRAFGADCILLIMAAVDDPAADEILEAARSLELDILVEVHDRRELDRALAFTTPLIGINNRNLKSLKVDLATTEALAPLVPRDRALVCESGLKHNADLRRMAAVGAQRFLVGESLMSRPDVAAATAELLGRQAKAV